MIESHWYFEKRFNFYVYYKKTVRKIVTDSELKYVVLKMIGINYKKAFLIKHPHFS